MIRRSRKGLRPATAWAALLLAALLPVAAQKPGTRAAPSGSAAEARTSRAFEDARRSGLPALRAFLYRMPKGADLHNHLAGAVYAETWIREAGEDHLCVDIKVLAITPCREGEVRADEIPQDPHLYDMLIDALSMRTFVPVADQDGHDHFFDTFAKFDKVNRSHMGEWLDEVATRAAAENEQYLELMDTPDFSRAAALMNKIGFNSDFAQAREQLLAGGIRDNVPGIRASLDQAEALRKQREHCGQADAQDACKVEIRYLYQILRGLPPPVVFAQMVLGFEAATADPRIVGMNLVMAEDGFLAMRDYRMHMEMLKALRPFYPGVHLTLHAGELAEGMVPPAGLKFHVRLAVEEAGAERIGHGVDILDENDPYGLLREMAAKHVMVEINLTSNDVILNVKGSDHPFMFYRKYGVPVALSTDDEGVSRIDLTHEYVRAAMTYPLSYHDLREMVRTGVEHSFLPGASLWQSSTPETLNRPVAACAGELGQATPKGACEIFVAASEKAQQQWELEHRLAIFEAAF